MTKVTAVFRGQMGSCGFKTNLTYTLKIYHKKGFNISIEDSICSSSSCEYESMVAFLRNWDNVINVK